LVHARLFLKGRLDVTAIGADRSPACTSEGDVRWWTIIIRGTGRLYSSSIPITISSTWAGDIVVKEHWGSSGFANTDLDFQLKQRGMVKVIVIGLLADTCIACTSRFAMERGYHVTLVKDATAAFSQDMMRAAHELNGPTFAHAIVTTAELVAALPQT
jgi:Isochorismatase family